MVSIELRNRRIEQRLCFGKIDQIQDIFLKNLMDSWINPHNSSFSYILNTKQSLYPRGTYGYCSTDLFLLFHNLSFVSQNFNILKKIRDYPKRLFKCFGVWRVLNGSKIFWICIFILVITIFVNIKSPFWGSTLRPYFWSQPPNRRLDLVQICPDRLKAIVY